MNKEILMRILQLLLFMVLFFLAVNVGHVPVFVLVTIIVSIWTFGFRSRSQKDRPDQLSAYSVFNRGFEEIQGSFTAKHYEKQLRSGKLQ